MWLMRNITDTKNLSIVLVEPNEMKDFERYRTRPIKNKYACFRKYPTLG